MPETAYSLQELIIVLEKFWADYGCAIHQPYNSEVGAGTFNPASFLRALGPEPWKAAHVEPSRRPRDGRYGENPMRVQQFLQYQVVVKPSPDDIQDIYLNLVATHEGGHSAHALLTSGDDGICAGIQHLLDFRPGDNAGQFGIDHLQVTAAAAA